MTTKLISLFALCVLLGLVLLACGGAADNANTATTNATTNANTKAAATPATTTATPASTTAAAGDIGVAECDEFLKKYEACISGKVPAAAQATFKTSLDTWRSSWKKLAETPQGKAGLAAACKSSMDTMRTAWKQAAASPQGKAALATGCKTALEQAKTNYAAYGCTW